MNTLSRAALYLLAAVAAYEFLVSSARKIKRRAVFEMAEARAKKTGLPLLVIGDPHNGIASIVTGPDYTCGDVCLDLTGCPECAANGHTVLKGSLEQILPALDLSKYVVYISCVLEYVSDLPSVLFNLQRVQTGNLFVVNVECYSFMAYFYPHFLTKEQPPKYIINSCPPFAREIMYSVNPRYSSQ